MRLIDSDVTENGQADRSPQEPASRRDEARWENPRPRKPAHDELVLFHAEICGALADSNRIAILYELADGPKSVGSIVEALGASQPTVSRHLKTLRERGMLEAERRGGFVFYSLADPRVIQALDLLREAMGAILERRGEMARALSEEG